MSGLFNLLTWAVLISSVALMALALALDQFDRRPMYRIRDTGTDTMSKTVIGLGYTIGIIYTAIHGWLVPNIPYGG